MNDYDKAKRTMLEIAARQGTLDNWCQLHKKYEGKGKPRTACVRLPGLGTAHGAKTLTINMSELVEWASCFDWH